MTQFMLVIGAQPQNMGVVCQPIHEDKYLNKIACELFTEVQLESCWFLEKDSVHDLFSLAIADISAGINIRQTIIGQLLLKLFQTCQEIVLWYSSDWNDLPEFTDIEAAMNEISLELMESAGEIYLRFKGSAIEY
jgi:hypothetical protein